MKQQSSYFIYTLVVVLDYKIHRGNTEIKFYKITLFYIRWKRKTNHFYIRKGQSRNVSFTLVTVLHDTELDCGVMNFNTKIKRENETY